MQILLGITTACTFFAHALQFVSIESLNLRLFALLEPLNPRIHGHLSLKFAWILEPSDPWTLYFFDQLSSCYLRLTVLKGRFP